MFGSLRPSPTKNTKEEDRAYKRSYCGLCQELKSQHGRLSTALLTYDLTFFSHYWRLLSEDSSDLLGSEAQSVSCSALPWRKVKVHKAGHLGQRVAGWLSIVLAKAKFQDDLLDQPGLKTRVLHSALKKPHKNAERALQELGFPIDQLLEALAGQSTAENRTRLAADSASFREKVRWASFATAQSCLLIFGWLARELFPDDQQIQQKHRKFGFALGQAIYLNDALGDRFEDARNGQFNLLNGEAISRIRELTHRWKGALEGTWADLNSTNSEWDDLNSSVASLSRKLSEHLPVPPQAGHPTSHHLRRKKQAAVTHCHSNTYGTGECLCDALSRCWWAAGHGRREREMERLQEELNPSPVRKTELSPEELSTERVVPLPIGEYACPGCETSPMQRVEIARGGLFYCQGCGGVWLFKSHLHQLKSKPESKDYIVFPQNGRPPTVMAGQRQCPIHKSTLEITRAQGVTVEECEECDSWYLDAGELGSLL